MLIVSPSLGEGGAQKVASTLVGNLDRSRLDIELCVFKNVIDFPVPADVRVTALIDMTDGLGSRPWLIPVALHRLRTLVRERRPDTVLSVIDQANLVVAAALINNRPGRWIARAGANPGAQGRVERRLARLALGRCDLLVGNSRGLVADLRRRHRLPEKRVAFVPNPVDFDAIDALASEPPSHRRSSEALLVWVGRMVPEKRPDTLVEAAALLRHRRPFQLWMCGAGPLTAAVASQIRRHELDQHVRLLGFCPNPYALCAQADVFVLTSEREGSPNALIEAQGLGVPAVSTDCRFGPSEIIVHGETGLLSPVGEPRALAESLDSMLADPGRLSAMSEAARRQARERFDVSVTIERWQRLLEGAQ